MSNLSNVSKIENMNKPGKVRRLLMRITLLLIILSLLTAASIYGCILFFAKGTVPQKADTILVLGCQVFGSSPSWALRFRLEKARELYNQGYAPAIIVSGGQGKNEAKPEAEVMKDWLVSHGVPEKAILSEDRSTSTYENLEYSKRIMERNGMKSTVIVSSDFHMFRALLLAGRLDIPCSGAPAADVAHLRWISRSREVIAVVKSFLLDR